MAGRHPALGLRVEELPTPALLVDLEAFESNCGVLGGHLEARGVGWRPHVKGHKSPALARRMIAAGAMGLTCAKVGEAEVMAAAGLGNLLVANQPATREAWARVARLQRATWVGVAIDAIEHVRSAAEAGAEAGVRIPLLVEVDIGMGRAGVRSAEQAVELAAAVVASGGELAGVMGYEGHALTVWPEEDKKVAVRGAVDRLVTAAEAIRGASIPVDIVSCGGSGSYEISSEIEGVTEIQAGGGCLMDQYYRERCHLDLRNALFLVASVSSRPTADRAILDVGWKGLPDKLASPVCVDVPGATVAQLFAEHLRLDLAGGADPRIGDRITLIPGYSDATVVLHDEVLGIRDGVVVEIIPLSARGALQ